MFYLIAALVMVGWTALYAWVDLRAWKAHRQDMDARFDTILEELDRLAEDIQTLLARTP